jgi:carboxyl-terminal processing protease
MSDRILAAWSLAALLAGGAANAEPPAARQPAKKPALDLRPLARRVWQVTDLVLERAVDPPARQQLLLSGLKALLRENQAAAGDLAARASAVTTEEQFAALLAEVWPGGAVAERENSLLHGLLASWPGEKEREHAIGYLTPKEVRDDGVVSGNRYVGTGIQIRRDHKEGYPQIVLPIPGGPARKAGARPRDLIVEIEGEDTKGWPLSQVVRKLQGDEGTRVRFRVRQPGAKEVRSLDLVRSVVPFSSVLGWRRTGEESWSFRVDPQSAIAYLRIGDLKASTLLELRKIEPLVRVEKPGALVLDLRFTTGTELSHAALVADAFLDGGPMWRVRDGRGRVQEYRADRDCLFRDWPLAVLVNEYTGGMAEAVAAAWQDNGRAVVVGEIPRGKGLAISLLPLPDGAGVRIPTGILERTGSPARLGQAAAENRFGRLRGILPDHRVAMDREAMGPVLEWAHLQESPEPPAPEVKPPQDRQLGKALAVLRETLARRDAGKKDTEKH